MTILERLQNQKGTVSCVEGKKIADEILKGNIKLIEETSELMTFNLCESDTNSRSIRSGASKVIEIVAEKRPELIESYLPKIIDALKADEPQTRWMAIRIFGFCAHINVKKAKEALKYAEKYISEKNDGLCLASSVDLFLADYGSTSKEAAQEAFQLLVKSSNNVIKNEHDWILEAFIKLMPFLNPEQQKVAIAFTEKYEDFPRKSTKVRIEKLKALS